MSASAISIRLPAGIEITHEEHWGDGVRSFNFADPAGNQIEIAEADIWPP